MDEHNRTAYRVSLMIPIYCGEKPLPTLIMEIEPLTCDQSMPGGNRFVIDEALLDHDCAPERSGRILEALSAQYLFVWPVSLSRIYGQHTAPLASMSNSAVDRVVTIDEDGPQDPLDIGRILDVALMRIVFTFHTQARLVFGNRDGRLIFCFSAFCGQIFMVNILLITLLIRTGLNAYWARALALVPPTIMSYFVQKNFVFGVSRTVRTPKTAG